MGCCVKPIALRIVIMFSARCLSILFALLSCVSHALIAAERYDVVIQGGRIVDGSGAPWFIGDVAIQQGVIAKIGRVDASKAERVIDAKGLVVAPGFIDMMGHALAEDLRRPMHLLAA